MVFSIGIISAKSSLSHIQSSLSSRKSATYQFHYFPYSSVDEVPQIYKEHEHECDGFVFSGSLALLPAPASLQQAAGSLHLH